MKIFTENMITLCLSNQDPEVIKTFFMLNSAEN